MRFTLLLFALGQMLKIASFTCTPFQRFIRKADLRILIKTADDQCARLFVFDRGKVTSLSGNHDRFDAALIFADAATGFSVLTSKKKDASFNAAADGKLKIAGMGFFAMWFEDATKQIPYLG